jgi:hypothetical protein
VQREAVADLIVAAVVEAFRPLVLIDEARGATAHVRQRGAKLIPEATLALVTRRGDAYAPWLRRFDRDGVPIETKPIPFTLLTIDEPRGGEALCTIASGLSNPLSIRRRGRTEQVAPAVGRPSGATTVRVTTRDGRPLAGCDVYVQLPGEQPVALGRTDEAGRVTIAADDGRVRTVIVTTRFVPLAKLPLVPGATTELVAPTTGEPALLAAEDRLAAWQAEFLDLIVARRVLLAAAERHAERGDRAAAEAALDRLDRGDKPSRLTAELEALRRRFVDDAGSAERMIESLFNDAAAAAKGLDDARAVADVRERVKRIAP